MKRATRPTAPAAFSLVEIALSIGVISFALLSIVALLPTGMETLRVSIDETAQARIAQEITGRLQGSDWDRTNDLGDFQGRLFYFDRQGNEIPATAPAVVFTAQVGVAPNGPQLPSVSDVGLNENLRAVAVKITSLPEGVMDRFSNPQKFRQLSMLAAKMSR